MIRRCDDRDFDPIWAIVNDGARAYKGIIPEDRWSEPYMSRNHLRQEIVTGRNSPPPSEQFLSD
jgi:hypothetical protein